MPINARLHPVDLQAGYRHLRHDVNRRVRLFAHELLLNHSNCIDCFTTHAARTLRIWKAELRIPSCSDEEEFCTYSNNHASSR